MASTPLVMETHKTLSQLTASTKAVDDPITAAGARVIQPIVKQKTLRQDSPLTQATPLLVQTAEGPMASYNEEIFTDAFS
jgi:hypothetical protein